MHNLTKAARVIPDEDISPTRIDTSGVEGVLTGKSFTLLSRPSRADETSPTGTSQRDHEIPRFMNPLPSFQSQEWNQQSFTHRPSQASTPPPEEPPVTQSQLITGAGGLFPSLPPSRASSLSSLTVGSESPTSGKGDSDDLTTPVATNRTSRGEILFSLGSIWTPPDSTPKRQRNRSPPPSPRPPKVARFDKFRMSNLPEDDEGYSEELPEELDAQQMFRNAQKRLFALAEFRGGSPSSQADIFGNPLVEDNDTVGENGSVVAATDSEDLPRSDSIGTSVACQYGQDEFIVELEWFNESEIESRLSKLLCLYQAAYLSHDEPGQRRETASAEAALDIFRAMAAGRMNWRELETALAREEEDVLNLLISWVRDMKLPDKAQSETFVDINACLGYLKRITISPKSDSEIKAWPFIQKIKLTSNGCIDRFLDGLPEVRGVIATSLSFDGAIEWKFDGIYCGAGEKHVAELVTAWEKFMIRDD